MKSKKLSDVVHRDEVPHEGTYWRVTQPHGKPDTSAMFRSEAFDMAREMWPDLEDDEDA